MTLEYGRVTLPVTDRCPGVGETSSLPGRSLLPFELPPPSMVVRPSAVITYVPDTAPVPEPPTA